MITWMDKHGCRFFGVFVYVIKKFVFLVIVFAFVITPTTHDPKEFEIYT